MHRDNLGFQLLTVKLIKKIKNKYVYICLPEFIIKQIGHKVISFT